MEKARYSRLGYYFYKHEEKRTVYVFLDADEAHISSLKPKIEPVAETEITKEEFEEAVEFALCHLGLKGCVEDLRQTPIVDSLPTDEDIDSKFPSQRAGYGLTVSGAKAEGAKWMRDFIAANKEDK